ncbi:histidine phosphatase family protein [Kineococcus rhizosphaerae]|uniref:Putative phosphoglycerate mutase n=1 Tax=Kineococcus rhizosphaerae TaxID=559628 RepID=A0A2T0QUX7_9ACTN|nr:histidine phosphatase family protein [Kineococcus rhizosphaerae]PRY09063.1 putative phosphoglycerate mutase [Kineococcus rhizosphaerae]
MRLFLVRHGQTQSNVDHLLDTAVPGADLSPLGRDQAAALVQTLGERGIGAITASTLVRTQQTAAPLAAHLGLDVAVADGLREIEAGDLEMLGDDDSVRRYLEVVAAWLHGDLSVAEPGAEDGHAFFARYDAAVAAALAAARAAGVDTLALVSHGAAIRTWAGSRVRNVSPEFVVATGLENTGVVELEGGPEDGWTCVRWMGAVVDAEQAEVAGAGPAAEPGSVF